MGVRSTDVSTECFYEFDVRDIDPSHTQLKPRCIILPFPVGVPHDWLDRYAHGLSHPYPAIPEGDEGALREDDGPPGFDRVIPREPPGVMPLRPVEGQQQEWLRHYRKGVNVFEDHADLSVLGGPYAPPVAPLPPPFCPPPVSAVVPHAVIDIQDCNDDNDLNPVDVWYDCYDNDFCDSSDMWHNTPTEFPESSSSFLSNVAQIFRWGDFVSWVCGSDPVDVCTSCGADWCVRDEDDVEWGVLKDLPPPSPEVSMKEYRRRMRQYTHVLGKNSPDKKLMGKPCSPPPR